jgi:hypothetical protein
VAEMSRVDYFATKAQTHTLKHPFGRCLQTQRNPILANPPRLDCSMNHFEHREFDSPFLFRRFVHDEDGGDVYYIHILTGFGLRPWPLLRVTKLPDTQTDKRSKSEEPHR